MKRNRTGYELSTKERTLHRFAPRSSPSSHLPPPQGAAITSHPPASSFRRNRAKICTFVRDSHRQLMCDLPRSRYFYTTICYHPVTAPRQLLVPRTSQWCIDGSFQFKDDRHPVKDPHQKLPWGRSMWLIPYINITTRAKAKRSLHDINWQWNNNCTKRNIPCTLNQMKYNILLEWLLFMVRQCS